MESELAAEVAEALETDPDGFQRRVREEADALLVEIEEGTFDNPQAIVGFEYEFYAVDDETASLRRVPRRLLEFIGFEKELGLHNAEMTTSPQPLNEDGLRAQEAEVRSRLAAALECTRPEGIWLVSDGMWTIPPEGETAAWYLTGSVEDQGIRIATNMSEAVRYHAMANATGSVEPAMRLEAPHVTLEADTVLPESLITSIQPHYQVPNAVDLPVYFAYALRIAGPLLSLGVNSPFFPPDLYDDVPPEEILADGWMEHRIGVFESVLNAPDAEKVRFPEDVDSVEEAVSRIASDETVVPMSVEGSSRFDDRFAHFLHKHGTYWRWVRPVFDGATRSAANARIEFRPIAAQPTVRDSMAFQAAYAGLLESLPRRTHPVADLPWERARQNFYAAAREGIDAEIHWIDADGTETTAIENVFEDVLTAAADGLRLRGLSEDAIDRSLEPLRARVDHATTPAAWKRRAVRRRIESGDDLTDAICEMQREYVENQRETLLDGSFADWIVSDS